MSYLDPAMRIARVKTSDGRNLTVKQSALTGPPSGPRAVLNQVRPADRAAEGNASSSQNSQANPEASKAQTMYSGGAVFDPDAWKTLFPDIAERFSDWVNDKQDRR